MNIRYFLENPELTFERKTKGASGYDVRADVSCERELAPGQRWLVSTGLYIEMPLGIEAQIRSRSGLAINAGVIVANAPGTIDSDYRGECKVTLINLSDKPYMIIPGERIAQIVFAPVLPEWHELRHTRQYDSMDIIRISDKSSFSITDRGASGHGSTGR